ncbi:transcription factor S-II, central domain-containing protein [Paraphysoderma sedebokerense]|nr:transcription factor S-II, central domain-containing protein [Paraphysoderma sedebokerense]
MKRQNLDGMAGYNKSSKESDNICSDSSVMKSKSSKDHSSSDKSSAGIHKSDKVEGDVKSTGRPKLKLRTGSVSSSRSSLTKNDKKSSSSSMSATSTTPVSAKHQRSDSSHRDNIVKFLTSAIESIFKDYMSDPVNSAELVSKDPSYPKTLADSLEAELFALYPDSDTYKAKVRSIRANLKDAKNDLVRRKFILTGEWSAAELAKMTPEQMNLEYQKLAEEIRIETMKSSIITDISRIPITKKTHKGEQEIESFGVRKAQLPEPEQRPITFVPNEEDSMDAAIQSTADHESGDHSRSRSHSRTPSISTSKYDIDHATGEHLEGDDQQEEFESPYEFKYNEDSIGLLDSIDIPAVQSPTSKEFTDTSPEVSEDTAMPIPSTSRSSSASLMAETPSAKTKINPLDILSSIPSSTPVSNSNNGVVSTPKPRLSITKTVIPTVPVWSGTIQSLNPAFSFNTDVIQAAGRVLPMSSQPADPWSPYLPKEFVIGGKIPDDKVTPYITQSIPSKNREVFVFRILPPSDVEGYQSYKTLFDLFHSRRRYAVVTERGEAKELRDFYICMFGPRDELPEWIENLENADNISDIRSDEWMMGVVVVNREKKSDSGSGTPQVPSVTRQEVNTAAWDQPEPTTSAAAEPAYRVSPPRSPGRKVQPALPQPPVSAIQPSVPINPSAAFDPSALQNLLSSLNPSAPPSSSQFQQQSMPNAPTSGQFPGNPPINMLNMFANLPNLQNFPNLPNLPNFPNMPNLNMMANLGFTNPPTQGMPSTMPYQPSQQQPSQQHQQQNQYSRGGYGGGDRRNYGNERGRGGGYSGSRSKGSSRGSGENVNGYPGWDREKEQQKERRGPYTRGGGRGGNRGRGSKSGGRGRGGSNW